MTTVEDSTTPAHGISRRRVIQGVAWTTPAILVATASPPAAASVTAALAAEPGFSIVKSTNRAYSYEIQGLAFKHGSSTAVTGLTVTVITTSNIELDPAPEVQGAGWSFARNASSSRSLVFAYAGSLPGLVATQALVVRLKRSNSGASQTTFTMVASGTANGASVSAVAGPITV